MKLWMMIGVPGSGKSTKAREIAKETFQSTGIYLKIFEADMYFINTAGEYCWKAENLPKAHCWCYDQVEAELKLGNSVIVANTFLKKRDRKRYFDLAHKYYAEIEVVVCTGNFKNIHGVPEKSSIDERKISRIFSR